VDLTLPIKKYPTKRNSAYNRKKFSSELSSIDRHFDAPSYSSNRAHAHAGGEKSVATLGPGGYIDDKMSDEPDPDEVKALTAFFAEGKKIKMFLGQANASSSIANTCLPKFR